MSRLLFLSRWFPFPATNGSRLRIYNLLRALAPHHQTTLLSFADQPDATLAVPELLALCEEVQSVRREPFQAHSTRAWTGFLSSTPRSIVDTFSPEMRDRIAHLLATRDYDVVIASQVDMAAYRPHFRHLPALFEEAEVGVLYEQFTRAPSFWHRGRRGLTWAKHRRYLARLLKSFQACTVVSEREKELLATAAPGYPNVEVVPNGIHLADYSDVDAIPAANRLIFTGSFTYRPNHEAMLWFVSNVLPHIRAQVPDVELFITGDHAHLPLPEEKGVTLTGLVDDVRPHVASAAVSIAPIWEGGGTRLKILEAMALRTPVVATSKGAEGLNLRDGEHLLLADSAVAFAEAVSRLLRDGALREGLADNAYQRVREQYTWDVVAPRFLNLVERVARERQTTNEQ